MSRMRVFLGVLAFVGITFLGAGCKPGEPLAGFTAEPTSGVAPLKVQFTDRSAIVKESTITGWSWSFGDGGTSAEQNPEHTYTAAGNFSVSLRVTSGEGKTDEVTLADYVKVLPVAGPEGEGEGEGEGEPPLPVPVPNVVGMARAAAEAAITAAGLAVGAVTEDFNATVPAGSVISQNPAAGVEVVAGSAVSLAVSRGPQPVAVPNVVGMAQADAQAAITAAALAVGAVTQQSSDTVPAGSVISQDPAAGASVAPGTAVNLVVSSGPGGTGGDTVTILLPGDVPLELVRVPAGSFRMGSPDTERSRWSDEGPVHTVTIGYDFYMGKYEVTQGQWLAVMGTSPGGYTWDYGEGANYPAYNVSWEDAQSFITSLNAHITATGQGPATLRLPSESEWEYACRAGTQTRFHFGDSLGVEDYCEDDGVRSQYMWYCGNNTTDGSKPVGGLLPNGFGLYDMSGNLWEWCEDWWHDDYTGAPADGSAWVSPTASHRVFRGGGWGYYAQYCRSALRNYRAPSDRDSGIGFRLASVR